MSTKYRNPADSQSAHAQNATPDKLAFIVSVLSEIDPALRKRIATAINLAGNNSMSMFPSFLQPIILYGLTQSFETPWGYHPYHAQPEVIMPLIVDQSLDVDKRFELTKVMLKHSDRSMQEWAKINAKSAGFTDAQLKELGLAPTAQTPATNAIDPTEALRQTALSMGFDPEAFVQAKELGVTYAEALELLKPATPVDKTPKPKAKATTVVK